MRNDPSRRGIQASEDDTRRRAEILRRWWFRRYCNQIREDREDTERRGEDRGCLTLLLMLVRGIDLPDTQIFFLFPVPALPRVVGLMTAEELTSLAGLTDQRYSQVRSVVGTELARRKNGR